MFNDFRGAGVRFPFLPAEDGSLNWIDTDDNVLQSVRLLLSTVSSERVMRPDFGTGVAQLLFEGDSEQNLQQLERTVRDAITRWEPRVEVEGSSSALVEGDDGVVQVSVALRILRTGSLRNLVFPFYLGVGDAAR
jgi:uncharacterized protein